MMTELQIFQIDAFTQQVFKGNPAAVVPLDTWLDDDVLQAIASENNLAETAFFVPNGDRYMIRWFTPTHEAPLCGHATLASAFVLFNELDYEEDIIKFTANIADLTVSRDGDLLILDFPRIPYAPIDDIPQALIDGLGKCPSEVYQAEDDPNYYAVFDDADDVINLNFDLAEIAKLHPYGLVATAPTINADCISRYFAPSYGIPEDPVTGSIHCVLVPYWTDKLGKNTIHAKQASPRTGELFCEIKNNRVFIAGYAQKYLTGTIYIDG